MASGIRISYHKRLFFLLLSFSWMIILCFMGFQYMREKQYKSEFLSAQLQLYNTNLLQRVEDGLSYQEYIANHKQPFDNLRVSIITLSGAVIYDNALAVDSLDNHKHRPEIVQALKKGSGYNIGRQSVSDGRIYFYSATCGQRVIVRTAIPYSEPLKEFLKADWTFMGIMFLISLIMSVLAYFATRRLGMNIERLNNFAAKVEKGEPFDQVKVFPKDELGSISNHIIELYSQLQQTIKDRDKAHHIALKQEQEKIRIKRQLTDNINHELKTPVASIRVCLETLLSGINIKEDKKQELLERCYVNNERLCRLLNEVSLITRMEDGGHQIGKEPVNINSIIDEIEKELSVLPKEESMALQVNFKEQVTIEGNLSLLGSIFRNLTENAIAYSAGENIYITLIENSKEFCKIRFEDDGKGVEQEQLTRIFERFYRIDKGRSRQKGGTGLGLAIVKHAVQFHGGTITASNRKGGGLCFDFSLRKTSLVQ